MAGKEIRAGKAFVEIMLRDKLQAGLKRAAAQLRAFARLTSTIGAGLTAASGSILGPLTAAVSQFTRVGDDVQKMADRTGMSAEAESQLAHAAELSGTSVEILETGIRKMQRTLGDAAMGGVRSGSRIVPTRPCHLVRDSPCSPVSDSSLPELTHDHSPPRRPHPVHFHA